MLNIGYQTTSTVTITFSEPVSKADLQLHDNTAIRTGGQNQHGRYVDRIALDQPWSMTGDMQAANKTVGNAGEYFERTADSPSNHKAWLNTMSTRGQSPFTSLTLTYSAPSAVFGDATRCGWQFIAIGNIDFCLA